MVSLRIGHEQRAGDEVLSGGEQRALGQLSRTGDEWKLCYEEPDAEGQGTRVELVLSVGEVRMCRSGDASSQAVFCVGKPSVMRYEILGHRLDLRVLPSRVQWEIGVVTGRIALEYVLQTSDSEQLAHSLWVEIERLSAGAALREQARVLLAWQGEPFGFLRWADGGDALLVSDAGRAAARRGVAAEALAQRVREAGWTLRETNGIWWLDPPEAVYRQALRECPSPQEAVEAGAALDAAWRDGTLGELQALCVSLLFQPSPSAEQPVGEPARALLRGAWRAMEGDLAQVARWARAAFADFAVGQRAGDCVGQSACGALLWRFLHRQGVGLPPEALTGRQTNPME